MDDNDLKKIADLVDDRINKALGPIKQDLSEVKDNLAVVKDTLENRVLPSVTETEMTLKSYADSYQINRKNIERVDTRLVTIEDHLGIEPPENLKVPHFTE